MSRADRVNADGEIFQTGIVSQAPDQVSPGDRITVVGEVRQEIPDASDNVVYGVVGFGDGTVLDVVEMSGFGSGTVTHELTVPTGSEGKELVWTFVPVLTESEARDGFRSEAQNDFTREIGAPDTACAPTGCAVLIDSAVGDSSGTQPNISISLPGTVQTDGEFEITVEVAGAATSAVEVSSSSFDTSLSIQDADGDGTNVSDGRVEFIDTQVDGGTYVVKLNITGGTQGDSGTITAYAGGEADSQNSDATDSSTFTIGTQSASPVDGVSDELWTAVTGDGSLSLGDLGNAIRQYRDNGQVNGVGISLADLGALIRHYRS
jgi:hypothetical protein